MTSQNIKISVLIATRNRPQQFSEALNSVLNQSYRNIEIIVINDGSDEQHLSQYQLIESNAQSHIQFIYLPRRPNGHGPSFARNTAAEKATGEFLAFLDDDDVWSDTLHLERFIEACHAANKPELYFTNQKAVKADGTSVTTPLWLESLRDSAKNQLSITASTVKASAEWLLSARGFAHLNCTIVKSALFKQVGGFDESLRYEEDKDLYWRLVDNADVIAFDTSYVAIHNVPDLRPSASNLINDLKKKETQLYIAEKNLLLANNKSLSNACKLSIGYACKNISQILIQQKKYKEAEYYIKKVLAVEVNFKWWLFLNYFRVINLFR